jgi:hypothetical protein
MITELTTYDEATKLMAATLEAASLRSSPASWVGSTDELSATDKICAERVRDPAIG